MTVEHRTRNSHTLRENDQQRDGQSIRKQQNVNVDMRTLHWRLFCLFHHPRAGVDE